MSDYSTPQPADEVPQTMPTDPDATEPGSMDEDDDAIIDIEDEIAEGNPDLPGSDV